MKQDVRRVTVVVRTTDEGLLKELFGTSRPAIGHGASAADSIGVELSGLSRVPGIAFEELVIQLAINFGTGVASGVVASWIWNRLGRGKENVVQVEGRQLPAASVEEVEHALHDGERMQEHPDPKSA